jgi:hypothetical protein
LDKKEILKARFILANKFKCPPDDILIEPILSCFERSLEEGYVKNGNKISSEQYSKVFLYPNSDTEIEAFTNINANFIINLILQHEFPFEDYIDNLCDSIENKYKKD